MFPLNSINTRTYQTRNCSLHVFYRFGESMFLEAGCCSLGCPGHFYGYLVSKQPKQEPCPRSQHKVKFSEQAGLHQGCLWSLIQFVVFLNRISTRRIWFWNLRVSSLFFADDMVLLVSLDHDFQHALWQFAAEHEAAGMQVSSFKSEAVVCN